MRLHISQDDEIGFRRAREWLLDGFGCRLRDEVKVDDGLAGIAVGDAGILLDWKFGYGDGHLARWCTDDLTEFLLLWCPRKLSVSAAYSVTMPGSVAAFTDYLAARGLLAAGSSASAVLFAAAAGMAKDFVAEMADPANFGMAKSLAGVVRRVLPDGGDHDLSARRSGGEVALLPAGVATVARRLAAAGFDVPVAGRLAEASAIVMLTGANRDNWVSLFAEIDAWRQCREPDQALAELAEAVRELDDAGLQHIALTVMSEIGPELAEPYVRELSGERPAVRGFALCWLADHALLDASALYTPGDLETYAYVLAHRLVTAGNEGLLACLGVAGDETSQVQLVTDLGRKAGPPAVAVLEAIGASHPARPVAKAARKALFVARSRLASQT